jgi:hypothetical protein
MAESTLVDIKRRCRSCSAEIYWLAHIKSRKLAPIDVEPVLGGNVVVALDTGEYSLKRTNAEAKGYVNHFATCPNAEQHR